MMRMTTTAFTGSRTAASFAALTGSRFAAVSRAYPSMMMPPGAPIGAVAGAFRFCSAPATPPPPPPTVDIDMAKAAKIGEKKESFSDPDMIHFRQTATPHPLYPKKHVLNPATGEYDTEWANPMNNAVWSEEEMKGVKRTHRQPQDMVDRIALLGIKVLRFGFDVVSGYLWGGLTKRKILRRILFLETAAGIPGMVAGSLRHLLSLRRMQRDYGWIHTLLEEAENERMHMLTFMKSYKPGIVFRSAVLVTQGVFWNVFFFAYLASPRLCHRFVGYLEEEAVRTYTHIIDAMESGDPKYKEVAEYGKERAMPIAIRYWKLPQNATMLDVLYAVRRDEANHRDVNHTFASMKANDRNPFIDHEQGPIAKKP